MNKIKVFEGFSGYGSQSISLKNLGIPHEVVGVSEIDVDAIISYGSLRYNIDDLDYIVKDKEIDDIRKELMSVNVGINPKKGNISIIPSMKKNKLLTLYKYHKAINNFGDISLINVDDLPNFDYFTYSFPCVDISKIGDLKGLIQNKTSSGLLYECKKIIEAKKPKYLLLENVKNLIGKRFKKDFESWCEYLESLGYHNYYEVLNSLDFNIPQNRERIFLISVLGENNMKKIEKQELTCTLKDYLDKEVSEKYYLKNLKYWFFSNSFNTEKNGNGFSFEPHILNNAKIAKTITARAGARMDDNYIIDVPLNMEKLAFKSKNKNIIDKILKEGDLAVRRLTPNECLKLMGLNDDDILKILNSGVSDTGIYKLTGNSIVIQCLDAIHKQLFKNILDNNNKI